MRRFLLGLVLVLSAGCGGDDDSHEHEDASVANADAAVMPGPDAGLPASDASCFDDPSTHEEIINACTTAQKIDKVPVLPLLEDDGTLPPLPD